MTNLDLIKAIQKMVAIFAIGPSALRSQGAPGVISAARKFLIKLDLSLFAKVDGTAFAEHLEENTQALCQTFPEKARHWGAARKALNLFLRDSFYNLYLNEHFQLKCAEEFFEIPLDGVIARELRKLDRRHDLPRWLGVKYLDSDTSAVYQSFAAEIAKEYKIARVHLDTFLWVAGR